MRRLWEDFLVALGLRKRLKLEFSERGLKSLHKFCAETGLPTAELVRRSLALYAEAIKAQKQGLRLMILDKDQAPLKEVLV